MTFAVAALMVAAYAFLRSQLPLVADEAGAHRALRLNQQRRASDTEGRA